VRLAAKEAEETEHGVIVQDTAWEGYTKIPSWIMQGYGTMAAEAADQLRQLEVNRPTHVFVQAGVGSLASSMVGFFTNLFPSSPPKFVIMEAGAADCLYQGAVAGDGNPRIVGGDLQTIMAGLACGEPNAIGWDILRNHADAFLSCPDWVSAKGMRMLAAPVKGDPAVTSGESGAVGMGVISSLMTDPAYAELRKELELGPDSQVLLFSTEGDTDPVRYRQIVWDGAWQSEKAE
jgi:diaminopropionate ammonia-lyase